MNAASQNLSHHLDLLHAKLTHPTDYELALNYFLEEFAGDLGFQAEGNEDEARHLQVVLTMIAGKMAEPDANLRHFGAYYLPAHGFFHGRATLSDESLLDGDHWEEDAKAYLEVCRGLNLPASLERSRLGWGGHVWFFFERALPANLARNMGARILTLAMESRPDIGLRSYDRLFPNQDTLPKGGFGNLIALPLQKEPRAKGNSLFVDRDLLPFPDQWAFLASIRRVSRLQAEAVVRDAAGRGGIVGVRLSLPDDEDDEPWTAPPSRRHKEPPIVGPLPDTLELVLGDQIYISKEDLPAPLSLQGDRADRRRPEARDRRSGCGIGSEPGTEGNRGRSGWRLRASLGGRVPSCPFPEF